MDPEVQQAQDRYEDSRPEEQIRHDDDKRGAYDRRAQLLEDH
jgi:hypothetical protein